MSSDESNNKKGWPTEAAVREFAADKTRAEYDAARGSIGGPPAVHLARIYGKTFAEVRDGARCQAGQGAPPTLFVNGTSDESTTIPLPKLLEGLDWNPEFVTYIGTSVRDVVQAFGRNMRQADDAPDHDDKERRMACDVLEDVLKPLALGNEAEARDVAYAWAGRLIEAEETTENMYVAMQTALDRIDSGDYDAAREALAAALKRHATM